MQHFRPWHFLEVPLRNGPNCWHKSLFFDGFAYWVIIPKPYNNMFFWDFLVSVGAGKPRSM